MQKFFPIDITSTGDNVIVPAQPNKKIRVIHYTFVSDTSCLVQFKSSTTTPITGPMSIVTDGGVATAAAYGGTGGEGCFGLFETAQGEALVLNNDAGNIGGHITVYLI